MSKREYFDWLINELNLQNDYHNHKETMSWVVTSIYVPSVVTLGFSLSRLNLDLWIIPIFTVSSFLAGAFIIKQLRLRAIAADTHLALTKVINKYCMNPEEFSPCTTFMDNTQFPQFIQDEIKLCKDKGRTRTDRLFTDYVLIATIALSTIGAGLLAALS
jgi:hypothetical protein